VKFAVKIFLLFGQEMNWLNINYSGQIIFSLTVKKIILKFTIQKVITKVKTDQGTKFIL